MNKIICRIFGHKVTWNRFSGEYGKARSPFYNDLIDVPIVVEEFYERCPRCGVKL